MERMAPCDRFYENINYYGLMASDITCLNGTSERQLIRTGKTKTIFNSSNWKYKIKRSRSIKNSENSKSSTKQNRK